MEVDKLNIQTVTFDFKHLVFVSITKTEIVYVICVKNLNRACSVCIYLRFFKAEKHRIKFYLIDFGN